MLKIFPNIHIHVCLDVPACSLEEVTDDYLQAVRPLMSRQWAVRSGRADLDAAVVKC